MTVGWVDLGTAALRYDVSGHGPETLVLLHEMGGTLESWDHVVPQLGDSCRVLRFDMRGSGLSEKIVGTIELDDLVSDLEGLLAHLGIDGNLTLAGCAVGAAVAIRFAVRNPGRISGIVAMSPALGVPPKRRQFSLDRADSVEREGMRPMTIAGHDRAYPPQLRNDPVRENAARAAKLGNDPHSFAAVQRMLAGLDMSADLKRIACRTLFLGGTLDGTRPPSQVKAMADQVAGAQFEAVISGHGMGYLTPDLVAERLRRFLAG
jgi:pimeloyl-ACP methyl ester carboxylesterase